MTKDYTSDRAGFTGSPASDGPPPKGFPRTTISPKQSVGYATKADLLFKVELALSRLENGDYGYCAVCRSEISVEELERDPSTVSCQSCQRADH